MKPEVQTSFFDSGRRLQMTESIELTVQSLQAYLASLKGIRPLWRELREPQHRLKKAGLERLQDGSIAKNPQRMGPLTFEARLMGLDRILAIQAEINIAARALRRPEISLINPEEEARIRELVDMQTWPQGWDGDEPAADTVMETVYQNGAVQPLLFSAEDA